MSPLDNFKPIRHPAWDVWSNPILRRYCRSRLRPRGLSVAILIIVLLAGFTMAIAFTIGTRVGMRFDDAARAGIIPLLILQSLILFIMGTAQVSGGMITERDEGVIDYQRLIPMTPLAKVMGYLFGLPIREYLLVLATLPFTAWCLWNGHVAFGAWLPMYVVLASSTLLYHITGLVAGTVIRNRRWAFLFSIGLVFCLYTVVPQMANYGLVFFKYLTITPAVKECYPGILPSGAGAAARLEQSIFPAVKFFNLNFSETVFTVFSQGGFVLTFAIMLCRKWRRTESHLLGKIWATGFFIWIQILLLGNALPLIEPGTLFPLRGLARATRMMHELVPKPEEAVLMSGIYGCVTMILIFSLGGIITPSAHHQLREWRRARKQERTSLPWRADASTSFWFVGVMVLAGAVGWFLFTRALVESVWFPGHAVPLSVLGYFTAVMLGGGVGFQVLLETKGVRVLGLAVILAGAVPIMTGAVLGVIKGMSPIASWIMAVSPASLPFYAAGSLLSISELPMEIARAMPMAFYFWLAVLDLTTLWLILRLHTMRRKMARSVLED